MCGIVGIINNDKDDFVNHRIINALTTLQHRGQDSAGIFTLHNNCFHKCKNLGTVSQVFDKDSLLHLKGHIGIGHVRYATSGNISIEQAQPFYTNNPLGIALSHNGNLTNTKDLLILMKAKNIHINTTSDSEILLNLFSHCLLSKISTQEDKKEMIFETVGELMTLCRGGYSVVLIINGVGLVAFRDPFGIRPLCYGKKDLMNDKSDYIISSESVAIDSLSLNFNLVRDVMPGECIIITEDCVLNSRVVHNNPALAPCIFEYIYFARLDSVIDGLLVYEARIKMGEMLAKKIAIEMPDYANLVDVIMPIPETSRASAINVSAILNIPYREGYVKNQYIARTFIMPDNTTRKKNIKLKLNTIKSEFLGKNVLIIDDSIVRGTTSIELIQLAREAGAKNVYFASIAPPVRFPNVYGIDIPTKTELIANGKLVSEIAESMNSDKVIFNDLDDLVNACCSLNRAFLNRFETSCFDGKYITGDIDDNYLLDLEKIRG